MLSFLTFITQLCHGPLNLGPLIVLLYRQASLPLLVNSGLLDDLTPGRVHRSLHFIGPLRVYLRCEAIGTTGQSGGAQWNHDIVVDIHLNTTP